MKYLLIAAALAAAIASGTASAESAKASNLLRELEQLTAKICQSPDLGPKDGEPIEDTPCYKLTGVSEQLLAMGVEESCASLREQNAGASWSALKPLQLRCVPMGERVNKIFNLDLSDVPKGWRCREDIFYDKKGRAGLVCSRVALVKEWTLDRPCKDEADCVETLA